MVRLTSGRAADGIAGLTWTSDRRVIFSTVRGGKAGLFAVASDETAARPLSSSLEAVGGPATASDGKYLFFHALDASGWRIWLSGVDGDSARPVSSGPVDFFPIASRDGRWIYYTGVASGITAAYKTPVSGGEIKRVGSEIFSPSGVLPDGRLLGIAMLRNDAGVLFSSLAVASPEGVIERVLSDVPLV